MVGNRTEGSLGWVPELPEERKKNVRKMVHFLSEALDQAKEKITSGYKEALADYRTLKREVREWKAQLCAEEHKSVTTEAEDLSYLKTLEKGHNRQ